MTVQNGSLFFKLLLNKYQPTKQDAVIQLLPEKIRNEIKNVAPVVASNPNILLGVTGDSLTHIHYSWLELAINTLKSPLKECVIAALPLETREKLFQRAQLNAPTREGEYPECMKRFLLSFLYKAWTDKNILPRELLPECSLSPLLNCTKAELVEIIDCLSMYDLAEEVRHIVDKKLIQAIIIDLTSTQQKFLKMCLHQKSKIALPPLNVLEAHRDRKAFTILVHKRGLKRLSIALSGLHTDFLWHIAHILDTGRGKILMSQYQGEEITTSTQITQLQVIQVLQFLKGKVTT